MSQENLETVRTMGTVFAVVLCIVTLETSSFLTRKANVMSQKSSDCAKLALANAEKGGLIAKEALALSNTVNNTVLALTRESPTIDVRMATTTPLTIQSIDDLRKEDFHLYIKNRGNVPVTGLRVHLSAVSGLTHAVDNPDDVCADFEATVFEVFFEELLMPQGFAFVDLRGPALNYLQRIGAECKLSEHMYHTPINVMVTPAAGDELVHAEMSSAPGGDQDLLQVRFKPALLNQPEAVELTKAMTVRINVFSPPPETTLAGPLGSAQDAR